MAETKNIRTITLTAATAVVLAIGVPVAHAATHNATPPGAAASTRTAGAGSSDSGSGWAGVVRQSVKIDMGAGWIAEGELDYPQGAKGRLPVVVLLHGSGHNDMDQSMPDGKGSTFVPAAQAITDRGYAVLRFNKRGVTGVGPVLSDDPVQLAPARPYQRILKDAAAVVRFAAASPKVDPSRIYLLGHSEGTQVAANLAAHPQTFGIPKPAGVIAMGVVGADIKDLIIFQLAGVKATRLHQEFDVNGDGYLTYREAVDGLIGQSKADAAGYRKVLLSGKRVNPATDTNHDGRVAIDSEAGRVFRKAAGVANYPKLTGLDQTLVGYLKDIARFGNVRKDLPRFDGPTLMLNGEDDIQTPARTALAADAAVGAAGNRDHTIITYPGMAHTMNRTTKFAPDFGNPDPAVLADIQRWLSAHN